MSAPARDPALSRALRRRGEWAVVTGASEGIGRAFAEQLAAQGLNVVLVARREPALATLAQALTAQHGVQTRVLALDLARADAMARLIADTAGLDVGLLVAAAGYGSSGALIDANLSAELDQLQVNAGAVLAQCWAFGRRFAAQRRGGMVLLSSVVAFQGVPMSAHYAATKAYVQSLAEALRHELAPCGVDVLACAPGPVDSGFARRAGLNMGRAASPQTVAAQSLAALGRRATVRPGALSKLLGWSLACAPRALRVAIMGRIMGQMARSGGPIR